MNPNPNPNLNAHNDPLNAILNFLPPIRVEPNPNQGLVIGHPVAQAAQNLARQLPQPVALNAEPPVALVGLGPGMFVPQPFPARRVLNLQPLPEPFHPAPGSPHTAQSGHSTQVHFSLPEVCKPAFKHNYPGDDSDQSPGSGRRIGV